MKLNSTALLALLGLASSVLVASSCSTEEPLCAQASRIVDECRIPLQNNPFVNNNACNFEETQKSAEELVSLHESIGCSGLQSESDRADGCLFCNIHTAAELRPFTTDGCSSFPDGTLNNPERWQQCCIVHDYAYYIGGLESDKIAADVALRDCVAQSCSSLLGDLMYHGVEVGGSPAIPTPWRWGYGWDFDPFNGFRLLSREEFDAATANVEAYKANPTPPDEIEQSFRTFFGHDLEPTVEEFNDSLQCD